MSNEPVSKKVACAAGDEKHPYVMAQMLELLASDLRDCPPNLRFTLSIATGYDDTIIKGDAFSIIATGTPQ